ncbi:MAG: hypothetical protein ACYCTH_07400 [Cellulomonas sp.]
MIAIEDRSIWGRNTAILFRILFFTETVDSDFAASLVDEFLAAAQPTT